MGSGVLRILILLVANVAGFGILWVAKYVVFNRLLFVVRRDVPAAGADGDV